VTLSNLEWVFTIGEPDVCAVVCIGRPVDAPTLDNLADHIDRLLVFPFLKRTAAERPLARYTERRIVDPLDGDRLLVDRLLNDAALWLAGRRQNREVLTGIYAVGTGFSDVAKQLGGRQCQSAVVIICDFNARDSSGVSPFRAGRPP